MSDDQTPEGEEYEALASVVGPADDLSLDEESESWVAVPGFRAIARGYVGRSGADAFGPGYQGGPR